MTNVQKIQNKLGDLDALLLTDEISIRYATAFPLQDAAVLISANQAWLFTDSRYIEAAENQISGFTILCSSSGNPQSKQLQDIVNSSGFQTLGLEANRTDVSLWNQYKELFGINLLDASEILSDLRKSKSPEELEYLISAQRIAEKALNDLFNIIQPGISEKELTAELIYRLYKFGGENLSFDPIVVTGAKTSMPHGVPGNEILQRGDFVTMDFGTKFNGYCSDMTRTIALGYATDEMKEIYNIVYEAQQAGISVAKAGVSGKEIDEAARKVITDAGYGQYFGHSFGHSLGLEIHESPNAAPGNNLPMPEGAVISAEPGIYIPGKFGVRIEDVIYLKAGGNINITKMPKELTIL